MSLIGPLLWISICLTPDVSHSDEAVSALKPSNGIEWRSMKIKIVDEQMNPLAGVSVKPWALRAGNAHGGWDGREFGAPRQTLTDAAGETVVDFPKEVRWTLNFDPVISVSLVVKHPHYIARSVHQNVPADEDPVTPELVLMKGTTLRIAGIEPDSNRPLPNCHLLIENSDVGEREYVREEDGWLRSFPIASHRRWFRVVCLPPNEPPRFSRLVAWNPDEPDTAEQRVEVRKGTRIEGRLSDEVPRPIQQGHVVVWCGSPVRTDDQNPQQHSRPIFWQATAEIADDGTFIFESLPTGYLAQFYAMADNFITTQPTDTALEQANKWFATTNNSRVDWMRYGHVFRLAGNRTEILLPMERAGEATITCLDPDGRPVSDVYVSSWPNQIVVGAGSTVFCNRISSEDRIRSPGLTVDWRMSNPYSAITGPDGKAFIRNLPARKQSFLAENDHWVSDEATGEITLDKRAELTIQLIAK